MAKITSKFYFFKASLLLFCIPLAVNVFICFSAICFANLNSDVMTYDSLIFSGTHSTFVAGGSRAQRTVS